MKGLCREVSLFVVFRGGAVGVRRQFMVLGGFPM
jgi:hypothetical protein